MARGVTITDRSVYIEADVRIEADTVISPCCHITGKTDIDTDAHIGPHVIIKDSVIGKGACARGLRVPERGACGGRSAGAPILAHHVRLMLLGRMAGIGFPYLKGRFSENIWAG